MFDMLPANRDAKQGSFTEADIRELLAWFLNLCVPTALPFVRRRWLGLTTTDVIAPPMDAEGGLFSEINDNPVAILMTYGTACVLLAGGAEAREDEYMASGTYTTP